MASTPLDIVIRPERGDDSTEVAAINAVVAAAFGSSIEAELVTSIRASTGYVPDAALVAEHDRRIVGHVMVSHVGLDPEYPGGRQRVASLSPLAVAPDFQRRGVGTALVRAALTAAERLGEPLVVLEGSPRYYGRLGFEPSAMHGIHIRVPSWASPEAAQIYRLPAYDPAIRGTVVYPEYFPDGEVAE